MSVPLLDSLRHTVNPILSHLTHPDIKFHKFDPLAVSPEQMNTWMRGTEHIEVIRIVEFLPSCQRDDHFPATPGTIYWPISLLKMIVLNELSFPFIMCFNRQH